MFHEPGTKVFRIWVSVVNRSVLVPVIIELTFQERCQNKEHNTKYVVGGKYCWENTPKAKMCIRK